MGRLAVVLFNLGGPDRPEAIEPFLFNLFNDPAIIDLPGIVRWPLAKFISGRRAPVARNIYKHLGGKSPLLEGTEAQAGALKQKLSGTLGQDADSIGVFITMRYWHPRAREVVGAVKAFDPERIVLLPLYPQFSTTTTDSSFKEWRSEAAAQGLEKPTRAVCCYPREAGFIEAITGLIEPVLEKAKNRESAQETPRLLFSAHGLPEKIVAKGDPYQKQTEMTAEAIVTALEETEGVSGLDWAVCYQSRVGRLKWIDPSLDDELERAAVDGKAVIVVPIAFVSEHSETLVELDIEYRKMADELGIPGYHRVPTVGADAAYISALARIVADAAKEGPDIDSADGGRQCPFEHGQCPL